MLRLAVVIKPRTQQLAVHHATTRSTAIPPFFLKLDQQRSFYCKIGSGTNLTKGEKTMYGQLRMHLRPPKVVDFWGAYAAFKPLPHQKKKTPTDKFPLQNSQ